MNHMAYKAAGSSSGPCKSEAGVSVADSSISKMTASAKAKADAAAQKLSLLATRDKGADWDASTKASDDVASCTRVSKVHMAEDLLRENPELRAVHSKVSVQKLLDASE